MKGSTIYRNQDLLGSFMFRCFQVFSRLNAESLGFEASHGSPKHGQQHQQAPRIITFRYILGCWTTCFYLSDSSAVTSWRSNHLASLDCKPVRSRKCSSCIPLRWYEPLELVYPTHKIARNDPSLPSDSQASHIFDGSTTLPSGNQRWFAGKFSIHRWFPATKMLLSLIYFGDVSAICCWGWHLLFLGGGLPFSDLLCGGCRLAWRRCRGHDECHDACFVIIVLCFFFYFM